MMLDDERRGPVLDEVCLDNVELDGTTLADALADELAALQTPAAAGCSPKWKLNWNSQRVSSIIWIP
jgi:hypothetical protein